MVNMEAVLILVQRGIRQGCPISGQLYSQDIELLLCSLRDRLGDLALLGFSELDHFCTVSMQKYLSLIRQVPSFYRIPVTV